MFTLTIFGFGPENGSTKGTLGMKFEPERLAFGGVGLVNIKLAYAVATQQLVY